MYACVCVCARAHVCVMCYMQISFCFVGHCRKASQFAESWQDGSAFTQLLEKQEEVASQREELEKDRKLLMKRKPGANSGKSVRHNLPHDVDVTGSSRSPQAPLTHEEYVEREEVLKLRAGALKKVMFVSSC